MSPRLEELAAAIADRFGSLLSPVDSICGELTYELDKDNLVEVATALRDEDGFRFETLIDLCGVDYLSFGQDEWQTDSATNTGFSRATRMKGFRHRPEVLAQSGGLARTVGKPRDFPGRSRQTPA